MCVQMLQTPVGATFSIARYRQRSAAAVLVNTFRPVAALLASGNHKGCPYRLLDDPEGRHYGMLAAGDPEGHPYGRWGR